MNNKNKKKIIIPEGTTIIKDEEFLFNEDVLEIVIPNTVTRICESAFRGCKNLKKINLPNKLSILEANAFNHCESLKSITIPKSLKYLSFGVFADCRNLKQINIHDNINYIDNFALYNCNNLEDFKIPSNCNSLGHKALMGCKKIKHIHIPKDLKIIENAAFAFMDSLEKITVDEENEKFLALNDGTVLIDYHGIVIQYAINSNNEEVKLGTYEEKIGENTLEDGNIEPIFTTSVIYNLSDYSFAGAKKLKKIHTNTALEGIGQYTFYGCNNLKTLDLEFVPYGKQLNITFYLLSKNTTDIPFEVINIDEGVTTLCDELHPLFKNARSVNLPESLEHIGINVFNESKFLKRLTLPKNLKMISPNTFYDDIDLDFESFKVIKASEFNMLQTKTNYSLFESLHDKDNTRILSLKDGTFYVRNDDYDIVKVTKDEISKMSNSSYQFKDDPDKFIHHLFDLIFINADGSHIVYEICRDKELKEIFKNFVGKVDVLTELSRIKNAKMIREILDKSGKNDESIFSAVLIRRIGKKDLVKIFNNYNDSIDRFLRLSSSNDEDDKIIDVDKLINYCNLLEKYNVYDKYLYNSIFFSNIPYEYQELLIKNYNKNIKNMIINSKTLIDFTGDDLKDLFKLCKVLGIFSDNKQLSQKMTTFINEKMFNPTNSRAILGNDIHRIFNELRPRNELDYEFIDLFVDNYNELIGLLSEKPHIICDIYNSFDEISKTSTSHRGVQRHLKVTLNKCLEFLLNAVFDGVNEDNKELATFLKIYYTEPYTLEIANNIILQSSHAPRNIFSKVEYDEDNNPIYSHNNSDDLNENNNKDFSYEWLPKQNYDNLILGKKCNCCAHILGAGAGIMRASMITDNCQNLIIKNEVGEIIAKMTIYVNKNEGYAVFNTAEINFKYDKEIYLNKIYKAFMRGIKAFIEKYNENNVIPIKQVNIGEYRNKLEKYFKEDTPVLEDINYGNYHYYTQKGMVGEYKGDAKLKQLLVYKK